MLWIRATMVIRIDERVGGLAFGICSPFFLPKESGITAKFGEE